MLVVLATSCRLNKSATIYHDPNDVVNRIDAATLRVHPDHLARLDAYIERLEKLLHRPHAAATDPNWRAGIETMPDGWLRIPDSLYRGRLILISNLEALVKMRAYQAEVNK